MTRVCSQKTCHRAGQFQPLENFSRDPTKALGVKYICKACRREQHSTKRGEPRFDIDIQPPASESDLHRRLFEATRKAPVAFVDLCDAFDLSPWRMRELVDGAKASGLHIRVEHDRVAFKAPGPDSSVRQVVPPVVGEPQSVAVISDLHFGSKYCLVDRLADFIDYAYARGVREVLCPGDLLDGNYVGHGLFELSHVGLEHQADALSSMLPLRKGMRYHAILGNHDLTFTEQNGANVAHALEARRRDLKIYGNRGAKLAIGGAVVELWHPKGGGSYAKSYRLQKRLESYSGGEKPSILLAGHFHQYCALYERGVHALLCPAFQGGGSAYGRAIGGAPALGGLILSWGLTEHGTLRDFLIQYRAYFEVEKPVRVESAS